MSLVDNCIDDCVTRFEGKSLTRENITSIVVVCLTHCIEPIVERARHLGVIPSSSYTDPRMALWTPPTLHHYAYPTTTDILKGLYAND